MQQRWRIRLLGRIAIDIGERQIERFPTQKMAGLLAYLALHPRQSHPREYLIDLFWPEFDREAGRNSLRNALSALRRQLEPAGMPHNSVILADKHSVRLNFQIGDTDVAEFERLLDAARNATHDKNRLSLLEQAAALYQGELMPGYYEEWVLQERERLAARHFEMLSRREALLNAGITPASAPPSLVADRPPLVINPQHNLPLYLTRFFDREQEQEQLLTWLHAGKRLITITGPGGSGKTRLAVEAAQQNAELFPGGIHFASLAEVPVPALLPSALANALRLTLDCNVEPLTAVTQALASASATTLLVLDNFEHLVAGSLAQERADCGAIATGESLVLTLLERAPAVICLATSRCVLGLQGEQELPLSTLPLPPDAPGTAAEMLRCPSVALYADRAQEARPDFAVTDRNAPVVARLCHRLEGMPLAIEMAAAWIKTLSPSRMLERLERQITLLNSRRTDVTPRHLSLHATIEWGYDLLAPEQQRAFTWLSVFRGGWTLEAAEALFGATALELLTQLRDRSFVLADTTEDEPRYGMLETLREYAVEQLAANDEVTHVRRLHAAHYADLARRAAPYLKDSEMKSWLERLNREQENLRLAIAWYLETPEGGEQALHLCNNLIEFWRVRGYWAEGRSYLHAARTHLGAQQATLARAMACRHEGNLEYQEGNYDQAVTLLHEALALFRIHNDLPYIAATLQQLGNIMTTRKDRKRAHTYITESVEVYREMQDWSQYYYGLFGLSALALQEGRHIEAREKAEQCLEFARKQQNPEQLAAMLSYMGKVAVVQGEDTLAESHYQEALAICRELNMRQGIATLLCNQAMLAIAQNRCEAARPLLAESLSICRDINYRYILCASLYGQGRVEAEAGNLQMACDCWRESAELRGKLQLSLVPILMQLARLAYRQGDWERATQCYGAMRAAAEPDDLPCWPSAQRQIDAELEEMRDHMGAEAFEAAFDRGAGMDQESALRAAFPHSTATGEMA
jgi:predicted ATPase